MGGAGVGWSTPETRKGAKQRPFTFERKTEQNRLKRTILMSKFKKNSGQWHTGARAGQSPETIFCLYVLYAPARTCCCRWSSMLCYATLNHNNHNRNLVVLVLYTKRCWQGNSVQKLKKNLFLCLIMKLFKYLPQDLKSLTVREGAFAGFGTVAVHRRRSQMTQCCSKY